MGRRGNRKAHAPLNVWVRSTSSGKLSSRFNRLFTDLELAINHPYPAKNQALTRGAARRFARSEIKNRSMPRAPDSRVRERALRKRAGAVRAIIVEGQPPIRTMKNEHGACAHLHQASGAQREICHRSYALVREFHLLISSVIAFTPTMGASQA